MCPFHREVVLTSAHVVTQSTLATAATAQLHVSVYSVYAFSRDSNSDIRNVLGCYLAKEDVTSLPHDEELSRWSYHFILPALSAVTDGVVHAGQSLIKLLGL